MPHIKINNKSLFYTLESNDSSPTKITAILLHGLGSSSCFYKSITPNLRDAVRCISIDTPGSGLSELGPDQGIETITKDVIGLLDTLKIQEKVILVGHSMGGIVANQIAAQYPDRVKGVVLLGPVHPGPNTKAPFEERIKIVKQSTYSPSFLLGLKHI
jgi:pimeloyl-ACP methyl ester carboxylesterase